MLRRWFAFLAFGLSLYGQTDAIGVSVSRTVDLTSEEITYGLAVFTDFDVSLDQVLEATKPLGLTPADLSGIGSQQFGPGPSQSRLVYQFSFTTAYDKLRETNDKLAALRRTLAAATPSMELQTFNMNINSSEASRDQARKRVLPQLMSDARARGQELAAAAGVKLGKILGLNDFAGAAGGIATPYFGPYGPYGPTTLRATFSLSVRFAVE